MPVSVHILLGHSVCLDCTTYGKWFVTAFIHRENTGCLQLDCNKVARGKSPYCASHRGVSPLPPPSLPFSSWLTHLRASVFSFHKAHKKGKQRRFQRKFQRRFQRRFQRKFQRKFQSCERSNPPHQITHFVPQNPVYYVLIPSSFLSHMRILSCIFNVDTVAPPPGQISTSTVQL
jgi:hypothetical protein